MSFRELKLRKNPDCPSAATTDAARASRVRRRLALPELAPTPPFEFDRADGSGAPRARPASRSSCVDVRLEREREIAHDRRRDLDSDDELAERWSELPRDRPVVLFCHVGGRSARGHRVPAPARAIPRARTCAAASTPGAGRSIPASRATEALLGQRQTQPAADSGAGVSPEPVPSRPDFLSAARDEVAATVNANPDRQPRRAAPFAAPAGPAVTRCSHTNRNRTRRRAANVEPYSLRTTRRQSNAIAAMVSREAAEAAAEARHAPAVVVVLGAELPRAGTPPRRATMDR